MNFQILLISIQCMPLRKSNSADLERALIFLLSFGAIDMSWFYFFRRHLLTSVCAFQSSCSACINSWEAVVKVFKAAATWALKDSFGPGVRELIWLKDPILSHHHIFMNIWKYGLTDFLKKRKKRKNSNFEQSHLGELLQQNWPNKDRICNKMFFIG